MAWGMGSCSVGDTSQLPFLQEGVLQEPGHFFDRRAHIFFCLGSIVCVHVVYSIHNITHAFGEISNNGVCNGQLGLGNFGSLFFLLPLVGNVGNMLATCRTDTSMSANFPDIPFFCRHPFLPIWLFPRVLMSGNANISIVTESTTLQLSTHNYKNGTTHIITCHNIAPRGHLSSHKYQIS